MLLVLMVMELVLACARMTVRKDVRDMTDKDWSVYTSTILKAMDTFDSNSTVSIWVAGAELHVNLYHKVHNNCMFLFWHRLFVNDMEKKLQKINPDFQFPYW